jgi:cobalt/nickel transport system permease protein
MHIPDGYLSPVFSLGAGVVTVPTWVTATRKVQRVLNRQTIPLMAIFSALSFTIMMFNVPVPGGTTAHGVGGTLIAIVLGPWAACLCVSVALIIQALFFGDGGILAIFVNCLNMGIILPMVGYYCYRLLAGKAPILSMRRIWAAAIGSYVGITAAALAVGIELGVQPLLFHNAQGQALYSPYPLSVSIPAMLLSHGFGASLVEALITALGFAYIQKHHPAFLRALRSVVSGADLPTGEAQAIPLWRIVAVAVPLALLLLVGAGLLTGGGRFDHLFGADWSQVSWSDVGIMLLIVLAIAAVLIPLAWFLLPSRLRGVGTFFVALAIFAPLGLIAPGFAFGEGSPQDVAKAFGYIPQGLRDLNGIWNAPLSGYNINADFFTAPNAPLWHAALGYEISGIVGILLLVLVVYGLASLVRRLLHGPAAPAVNVEPHEEPL